MKLYFAPNACSLSPHIVLRELGLPFKLIRVNNKTKQTSEGRSFLEVNPKGYVAALMLDNGKVLTEGPAILQYLADLKPESKLAPMNGTWERVRLQETLNYISSEIHAGCSPLFSSGIPETVKDVLKKKLYTRLDNLDATLLHNDYLHGAFSVADAYLYTVLSWLPIFSIDVKRWPALARLQDRIGARPATQAALAAEEATPAV
ncbi:MAG: Glutathione S-transferase (EC [uncultured Paraburkholderia sp.]|nr:MAG: Glutathione S-transferase (EC [uncultured Paraburkholderia sp.]CAH2798155.1 MAG: Glutathione S-transferase (EC [uncultured Paraburkholderia sp.]CAH2932279.1 MAG: Glutathione S-transferase (EC [uncultured Paraburkholderia sp.]CAH2933955.1 MAG: Glutathione S-transferase (EC [uncultured Paraburkholderia sp.]